MQRFQFARALQDSGRLLTRKWGDEKVVPDEIRCGSPAQIWMNWSLWRAPSCSGSVHFLKLSCSRLTAGLWRLPSRDLPLLSQMTGAYIPRYNAWIWISPSHASLDLVYSMRANPSLTTFCGLCWKYITLDQQICRRFWPMLWRYRLKVFGLFPTLQDVSWAFGGSSLSPKPASWMMQSRSFCIGWGPMTLLPPHCWSLWPRILGR